MYSRWLEQFGVCRTASVHHRNKQTEKQLSLKSRPIYIYIPKLVQQQTWSSFLFYCLQGLPAYSIQQTSCFNWLLYQLHWYFQFKSVFVCCGLCLFPTFPLFHVCNIQQFQRINWWKTVLSSGKYVMFRSLGVETIKKEQEKNKKQNPKPSYMLTICT